MKKLKEDSIEAIKGTFDRLIQRSQARQAFFRNFRAELKKLPDIKSTENPSQDKQKELGCG